MNMVDAVSKKKSRRPFTFLGVGIFNTVIDYLFYTFLTQTLLTDPKQIGLAGILSGTFALLCAFTTHALITWRGSRISNKTLAKFFILTGFGMWVMRRLLLSAFISLSALYAWCQQIFQKIGLHFDESFIANTGAFGLMVLVVLVYNYFVYDRFVFKERSKP